MKRKPSIEAVPDDAPVAPTVTDFGQNQHVAEAVKAYCNFPYSKDQSLMVTGKWGSGKTFLIMRVMEELIDHRPMGDRNKPLYVSLYGVRDQATIGELLYQQLHPFLAGRAGRIGGALIKGLLKASIKIDASDMLKEETINLQVPDLKVEDILAGTNKRIIIFDDFERSLMNPVELLGYINPLAEQDGCKVIILAYEKEIEASRFAKDYKKRKEKTVCQTIEVHADADVALSAFLAQVADPASHTFFDENRTLILVIFAESQLENLRLLRQFLWDFETLRSHLTEKHLAHTDAMRALMAYMLAITLELRSGNLDPKDLQDKTVEYYMRKHLKQAEEATTKAETLFSRYESVDFESPVLRASTAREIILRGVFDRQAIRAEIDGHPLFVTQAEMPSWKALVSVRTTDPAEMDDILRRFKTDFDNRVWRDQGEVAVVASLCLWLADIGENEWPKAEVVWCIKEYIDYVFGAAAPDPAEVRSPLTFDDLIGGVAGVSLFNPKDGSLEDILKYFVEKATAWFEKGFPEAASNLLDLLRTDTIAFRRQISRLPLRSHHSPTYLCCALSNRTHSCRQPSPGTTKNAARCWPR